MTTVAVAVWISVPGIPVGVAVTVTAEAVTSEPTETISSVVPAMETAVPAPVIASSVVPTSVEPSSVESASVEPTSMSAAVRRRRTSEA